MRYRSRYATLPLSKIGVDVTTWLMRSTSSSALHSGRILRSYERHSACWCGSACSFICPSAEVHGMTMVIVSATILSRIKLEARARARARVQYNAIKQQHRPCARVPIPIESFDLIRQAVSRFREKRNSDYSGHNRSQQRVAWRASKRRRSNRFIPRTRIPMLRHAIVLCYV